MGDPDHDQEKLQPTAERSEMGTWSDRDGAGKNPPKMSSCKAPSEASEKTPTDELDELVLPPSAEEATENETVLKTWRWGDRNGATRTSGQSGL